MAGQLHAQPASRSSPMVVLCLLLVVLVVAGCRNGTDASAEPSGQITRSADIGLPLEYPEAVAAFNTADRFLVKWFFLKDADRAVEMFHPNLRDSWRPVIEETEVRRMCSFVQVGGTAPDAAGAVTARYAIDGCQVVSPGGLSAVYIEITLTNGEGGPFVNQVEFLR